MNCGHVTRCSCKAEMRMLFCLSRDVAHRRTLNHERPAKRVAGGPDRPRRISIGPSDYSLERRQIARCSQEQVDLRALAFLVTEANGAGPTACVHLDFDKSDNRVCPFRDEHSDVEPDAFNHHVLATVVSEQVPAGGDNCLLKCALRHYRTRLSNH